MPAIRVVVVEDSLTVRKRLVQILSSDPDFAVVGEAGDGRTAITMCEMLRPDVMALDMVLPVMTGLDVTEHVMAHFPTPILVVSASTNRGELFQTYDALAAGALDVLDKPTGVEPDGVWERKFLSTMKLLSRIKVITHPRARLRASAAPAHAGPRRSPPGSAPRVVAIGASTGGPAAVRELLNGLPVHFPLPILLVIHLAEGFGAVFADWLDSVSPLRVSAARTGDRLPPVGQGKVFLAPPNAHLVLRGDRLELSTEPERNFCRPSVDVLFESVAREVGPAAIACVLTGMGRDGAAGLLDVRRAGGRCIAQDEATSIVYGMPREAALLGAAQQVLPLPDIAGAILQWARVGSEGEA
ncbi:MAG TPA: chemotaxis-specific protein-glutamate methyltransferase CheB [Polyangiaceae bacterium]|jgi:two-component system chemotaxis response regulator CheB|nr:chemotaxis-specific protein-glutamate methyltransferase CheB [Polyangiaceae bacterium]